MIEIKALASGSAGNCYRVSDGRTGLLLDAGIPLRRIQEGIDYRLSEIAGALISHRHMDHARAVYDLAKRGMLIAGPPDIADTFTSSRALRLRPLEPVVIDTWRVTPFPVQHDAECYGYMLDSCHTGDRLVYITDAESVPYTFEHVNYMMLEANYSAEILAANATNGRLTDELAARIAQTHMSIEHAAEILSQLDPHELRQVWLLHLSNDNSNAEEFRRIAERTTGVEVYIA